MSAALIQAQYDDLETIASQFGNAAAASDVANYDTANNILRAQIVHFP